MTGRLAALAATSAALAAAAVLCTAAGQQTSQPPIFRSATDLVEVDVSVQDRTGRFVDDLTTSDFQLDEDGRRQSIELLYRVGNGRIAPASLSAGGAAASPESQKQPQRTFVVLFDDEHLTPGGFKRVQAAAESLFASHFGAGDVGGVVADGRMANGRLTTDREELLAAVRAAKPNSKTTSRVFDERQWPRMSEIEAVRIHLDNDRTVLEEVLRRACLDDPTMCQKGDPTAEITGKASTVATNVQAATNATLQRIAAVLRGLTRFEGRKTVLLLSEGFIAEEAWPGVEAALGLAAGANARIYTLDARGLDRGQSEHLVGSNPQTSNAGERLLAQLDFGSDSVNSLAVDSGGFVVRNTNFFDQAVERITADAANYYVVGYRSDRPPDGKFRKLAVSVMRRGAVVRARRGYVATPHVAPAHTVAVDGSAVPKAVGTLAETSAAAPREPAPPVGTIISDLAAPAARNPPESVATAVASAASSRLRPDSVKHARELAAEANGVDASAAAGWEAYQRGDVESARASLASAAASPGARPWVHYALGQSEYALRDWTAAIGAWERVRASTPEFEPVYFDLVDGYLQTRDYDKATRVLRAAAARWPSDHEVWSALGVVQVRRGSLDDAIKSFERSIAVAPSDATGYFNLGKTLELRYRKGRRFIRQTGTWVENDGDKQNAIANYKRYLEIGGPLENSAREGLSRLGWR